MRTNGTSINFEVFLISLSVTLPFSTRILVSHMSTLRPRFVMSEPCESNWYTLVAVATSIITNAKMSVNSAEYSSLAMYK